MFTHLNHQSVQMVDVSDKEVTKREAKASGMVKISAELYAKLINEPRNHKGSIFDTSIVAGIMGAKKCSELIPMCHPLPLNKVEVTYELKESGVVFHSTVSTMGKTGVEMEALTAISIAALTFYDMVKSTGFNMEIGEIKLTEKSGGKSDFRA